MKLVDIMTIGLFIWDNGPMDRGFFSIFIERRRPTMVERKKKGGESVELQ